MHKFRIIEINANVVRFITEDGIKFEMDRIKFPEDVEIGDTLHFIEHRRYDLYSGGEKRYMKKGLIPLTEMRRVRE